MQVWLDATTLFRGFCCYETLMPIDVMQRLHDGAAIEIELTHGVFDAPTIRAHVRDQLRRRLAAPFENQLPAPRVRHANEKVIG